MTMSLRGLDPSTTSFRFHYAASDPAQVVYSQDPLNPITLPDGGFLRIWTKDGATERQLSDFIMPDHDYSASDLGLAAGTPQKTLWLEGIAPASAAGNQEVELTSRLEGVLTPLFLDKLNTTPTKVVAIDAQAFGPKVNADGSADLADKNFLAADHKDA